LALFATRCALAAALGLTLSFAQARAQSQSQEQSVFAESFSLPDNATALPDAPVPRARRAAWYRMTIAPNETAPPLSVFDKVLGGIRDSVYPPSPLAWIASAGWAQVIDGSPNYGTNSGAFGQRIGAAALRDISETVFSKSVFAPILHEDPRYFQMGHGHSIVHRSVYAASRVFVTRTDEGGTAPNYALILGHACGVGLATAYYPARNRTFGGMTTTYAGSLGGAALGYLVDEFLDDGLRAVHLKKAE